MKKIIILFLILFAGSMMLDSCSVSSAVPTVSRTRPNKDFRLPNHYDNRTVW